MSEAAEPGYYEALALQRKAAQAGWSARIVRQWVLSQLLPDVLQRQYEIGMGITTFATPTAVGNVVQVEAPPSVQRAALSDLIRIGIPQQVGLMDDDGNKLPGVIALGAYDMEVAQAAAHGARHVPSELPPGEPVVDVPPPKATGGYELPAEHELVVVEEGVDTLTRSDDDRAPGPIVPPAEPTPAQIALAAHRARQGKNGSNGHGPASPSHLRD